MSLKNWLLISWECEEVCLVKGGIPTGVLAGGDDVILVKNTFPLFPRSCYFGWPSHNQLGLGKQPWWSFWNGNRLQHDDHVKLGVCRTHHRWRFELLTSQPNLLFPQQNTLLGAICTSKPLPFLPTTFSPSSLLYHTLSALPRQNKNPSKWCDLRTKISFSQLYMPFKINIIVP